MNNYDPNITWSDQTVEITYQLWDYTKTVEVKISGNCRIAALEEAAQICSHKAETKRLFLNEAHYLECAEAIRGLK